MIFSALWSKALFGEETNKCMYIYSQCKHRLHLTLMALQPSTAFSPTGNINYALFLIHRAVYKMIILQFYKNYLTRNVFVCSSAPDHLQVSCLNTVKSKINATSTSSGCKPTRIHGYETCLCVIKQHSRTTTLCSAPPLVRTMVV